jgi:hypothetical protein
MDPAQPALFQTLQRWQVAPQMISEKEIRDQVHALVDAALFQGWPPEKVIVTLKRLAVEAGLQTAPETGSPGVSLLTREKLLREMVQWAIRYYYGQHRA